MAPQHIPVGLDVTSDLGGVYLKKADVENGPRQFTITNVERVLFEARNQRPAQTRIVLTFAGEPTRKLSLNKTNLRTVAKAWGSHAAAWIGRALTVEHDESVQFAGELVGGLRVKIPRLVPAAKAAANPAMPAVTNDDSDDDIAFAFGRNAETEPAA